MLRNKSIVIPIAVRIKPDALDRVGIYARRLQLKNIVLVCNKDLNPVLVERVQAAMKEDGIEILQQFRIDSVDFNKTVETFQAVPQNTSAVMALGGGKALDVAKYVAFLAQLPYIAVPTILSNDGFCSPQASLELEGRRRSFPAAMPSAVIIDTRVCLSAPKIFWLAGIGDLVAKITAIYDWKLWAKANKTVIDDFAALLSDATVFQLMAKPDHDLEGIRLLGTSLMLNGIAMEISGSSRPASGSEHLISHALDEINKTPRLHGLQVGVASYIVSLLQGQGSERIAKLFDTIGFWQAIQEDPLDKSEWLAAFRLAPTIKPNFYTVLSERDRSEDFAQILNTDVRLKEIFKS
jgi:glycerol-1-phosphate dehydrogenase [NAD(P)+]